MKFFVSMRKHCIAICVVNMRSLNQKETSTVLIMLYFIAFIGVFAVDFYLPAIPGIAKAFKVDASTIDLTMSIYTFTFALGHLIVGSASDYLGRKITFEIGLIISIIGTFFCMMSNNFLELFISRGIQGFGLSCFVLTNAMIRDVFRNELAVKIRISRNLIAYFLIAVAPSVGVIVLKFSNWRMIFALFLFFSILIFIYVRFFGIETNNNLSRSFNIINTLKQYTRIVSNGMFMRYASISTLGYSVHFCFVTISSVLLVNQMKLHSSIYGACMFAYGIFFLTGAVIAMVLVKRFSMQKLLSVGGMLITAGGFILIITNLTGVISLLYLLIAVLFCVLGISILTPGAVTLAMTPFETQAGAASACLGVMQFAIAAIFSAIVSLEFEYNLIIIGSLAIMTGLSASCFAKPALELLAV